VLGVSSVVWNKAVMSSMVVLNPILGRAIPSVLVGNSAEYPRPYRRFTSILSFDVSSVS
jgi:hypothetical protein